jgi:hypothetical protein
MQKAGKAARFGSYRYSAVELYEKRKPSAEIPKRLDAVAHASSRRHPSAGRADLTSAVREVFRHLIIG